MLVRVIFSKKAYREQAFEIKNLILDTNFTHEK
jgi:hypothetical protein